jgi:hypothetical protein
MKYHLNVILSLAYARGHKALPYIDYSTSVPHGDVGAGFIPARAALTYFHAPRVLPKILSY